MLYLNARKTIWGGVAGFSAALAISAALNLGMSSPALAEGVASENDTKPELTQPVATNTPTTETSAPQDGQSTPEDPKNDKDSTDDKTSEETSTDTTDTTDTPDTPDTLNLDDSEDPGNLDFASAISPEGVVMSISDVPENEGINVIELTPSDQVLVDEPGWARLASFIFVADAPDGSRSALVNVNVGREYAGRQVQLSGLVFRAGDNWSHGAVSFDPVTVGADGNAVFNIRVDDSGIDPSDYANHENNEFTDLALDVQVQGEKVGSQTSNDKLDFASNKTASNKTASESNPHALPQTGDASAAVAGLGAVGSISALFGAIASKRRKNK